MRRRDPRGRVAAVSCVTQVLQRVPERIGGTVGIAVVQTLVRERAETLPVQVIEVVVPVLGADGHDSEGRDGPA